MIPEFSPELITAMVLLLLNRLLQDEGGKA